ncbi:MAG TPA: hypothetical protein PLQ35_01940 [bacterium]|nr:hypothetical protein [bacterium]HQL61032.1 hypothetical protein [bacterium]
MHLSFGDILLFAFEDIVNAPALYAVLAPCLVSFSRSIPSLGAAISGLGIGLLVGSLLPGIVENRWPASAAVLILFALCLRPVREWMRSRSRLTEVDAVLMVGSVLVLIFSLICVFYSWTTGQESWGIRPVVAVIVLMACYRRLLPAFLQGKGNRIAKRIALAGAVILCARGMVWYGQYHTLSSARSPRADLFVNIHCLEATQKALEHLGNNRMPEAVTALRGCLIGGGPETVSARVAGWSGLEPTALPLMLAFGGHVPVHRRTHVYSSGWDGAHGRILALGERGRLWALTRSGAQDLGAPLKEAIALTLSADGSQIGLISEKGRVFITDQQGKELWKLWLPESTYRDIAGTESPNRFLALRADGAVYNVTHQGSRLLEGYPTWKDTEPAVSIVSTPDGKGHYVLDRFGGVHPRGETPIRYEDLKGQSESGHYWPEQDTARAILLASPNVLIYVDRFGGLHSVVKSDGTVSYRGHDYPPLNEPVVVDVLGGIVPGMFHIVCEDGRIMPIPDYGWLIPRGEHE